MLMGQRLLNQGGGAAGKLVGDGKGEAGTPSHARNFSAFGNFLKDNGSALHHAPLTHDTHKYRPKIKSQLDRYAGRAQPRD